MREPVPVRQYFEANGPPRESLDILFTSEYVHDEVVLECVRLLAVTYDRRRASSAFCEICLIVPQGIDWPSESALCSLRASLPVGSARVIVRQTVSREAASLVDELLRFGVDTAVICANVDMYECEHWEDRPDWTGESILGEAVRHRLHQQLVAQQLSACALLLNERRSRSTGSVLFVSGSGPLRDAVAEVGTCFDSIGVIDSELSPPQFEISDWMPRVQQQVETDELIEEAVATGLDPFRARQVIAFALYRAGRHREAHSLLTEVLQRAGAEIPATLMATAARVALDASDEPSAERLSLLVLAAPRATPLSLRIVAQVARGLRNPALARETGYRLHSALPRDPLGLSQTAESMIRERRYAEAVEMLTFALPYLDGECRYLLSLAFYRANIAICPPVIFIAAMPAQLRERAIADCILSAAELEQWDDVTRATAELEGADASAAGEVVAALCSSVSRWSLAANGSEPDSYALVRTWMDAACSIMACCPADGLNRTRMEKLGESGVLGEVGFVTVLAPLVRDSCGSVGDGDGDWPTLTRGGASEARAFGEFFRRYVAADSCVVLAPKPLRVELNEGASGDLIQGALACLLELLEKREVDDSDINCGNMILSCTLDIMHSHFSDRAVGAINSISLVQHVATLMTLHGKNQEARDLIETALLIAASSCSTTAVSDAWLAFADICLRSNQPASALLAIVVGGKFLGDGPRRRFRYHYYAARAFRDVGLLRMADIHLAQLNVQGGDDDSEEQLRGLGWSIGLKRLFRQADDRVFGHDDHLALQLIIIDASRILSNRIDSIGSTAATATYLFAALTLASETNTSYDCTDAHSVLMRAAHQLPPHLEAALKQTVSFGDLQAIAKGTISPRYGADATPDAATLRVLTRRFLSNPGVPIAERTAALEALYDLELAFGTVPAAQPSARIHNQTTIRLFEAAYVGTDVSGRIGTLRDYSARPRSMQRLWQVYDEPGNYLATLLDASRSGTALEASAVIGDELCRLVLTNGEAEWVVEDRRSFNPDQLGSFESAYPYGFHAVSETGYLAEERVRAIMTPFSMSSSGRSQTPRCFVPDPRVVAVPGNLQLVENQFVGDLAPTTQAPSLAWLGRVHKAQNPLVADATFWAVREDDDDWTSPIAVCAGILEGALESYAKIRRGVTLSEVSPTNITYVLAHGGLGLDRRHFSRISDDVGTSYEDDYLVEVCRGAFLVVLLVCSGGRTTMGLINERMHGLPHKLIRNGARAVVASPWPLDILVAAKWAPQFAKRLAMGESVATAAFSANRTLSDRAPKDRLAMHVYGDPWLRFLPLQAHSR